MTLTLGTIVGQFKMPASFLQENFMDNACVHKAFEGAVNSDSIWAGRGKTDGYFVGCLGLVRLHEQG